jgi:TolB-like protein
MAVQGTRVFVAGATETSAGGAAFTLRAYSAKDGSLLWGDNFDREGDLDDIANAVAVQGNKVFVAGLTRASAGGAAFTLRAYSAKDGSLLWGDNFDREGDLDDIANAVAVQGNKVFVAGLTETSAGGAAFTVRAYSAKDGSLLWENFYDREGDLDDIANAVAVRDKEVFVAGLTRTSAGGAAFTLRAYSAKDGSLLWENFYDREGTGHDVATTMAVQGTRVFVAGATETSAGGAAFTLRAYAAKHGSLRWGDNFDREGNLDDIANAVAVRDKEVFVAGLTRTSAGGAAFTLRAYVAKHGSLRWGDNFDREGTGYDVATTMAVRSRVSVAEADVGKVKIVRRTAVFVAGATETSAGGAAFTVRAYSTKYSESRTF